MQELKEKKKSKGILSKTWERCKSFGHLQIIKVPQSPTSSSTTSTPTFSPPSSLMVKSKSWSYLYTPSPPTPTSDQPAGSIGKPHTPPHGYFSVYVGPEKQRFVIKVECTKHPLFKMLLEEAELEYGFHIDGPLVLPCEVDLFIKVLIEMDGGDDMINSQIGCRFPRSRSSYYLLSSPGSVLP